MLFYFNIFRIFFKVSEVKQHPSKQITALFYTVSMDGSDQYYTSKRETLEKNSVFTFKEKFAFTLISGVEDLRIKFYGLDLKGEEMELSVFIFSIPDYLVKLVD
jgi:hypothetical protein